MNSYQTIALDLSRPGAASARVKQFDSARRLELAVTDNGAAYALGGIVNAACCLAKPDGTTVVCPADITDIEKGKLTVDLPEQAVAAAGIVRAELLLYGSGAELVTSFVFQILVYSALHDDRRVESTDEFSILTRALSQAGEIDARLSGKRDKSVKLTRHDFDLSSDAGKLGLANLSDEVRQAMAGSTSINASVEDGAVTTEKYAENSLSYSKLYGNLQHRIEKANIRAFGQILSVEESGTGRVVTTEPIRLHVVALGSPTPRLYKVKAFSQLLIPEGQAAYVDLDQFTSPSVELTAQVTTTTFLSAVTHGDGAFFDDRRVLLLANSSGYLSGLLSENVGRTRRELQANRVFFPIKGLDLVYDVPSRTLSWTGSILLVDPLSPFRRTKLVDGSYTFANNQYQVCYIDLSVLRALPDAQDGAGASIKGGSYSDAEGFRGEPWQLPVFWLHDDGYGPVGGFPQPRVTRGFVRQGLSRGELAVNLTTNALYVYCHAKKEGAFLEYCLFHEAHSATRCDVWRLYRVFDCRQNADGSFTRLNAQPFVNSGEWECAIREQNSADGFVGGGSHGNELLQDAFLLVDGVKRELGSTGQFYCSELRFVEKTTLLRYGTQAELADHFRSYQLTEQGVRLKQSLVWAQPVDVANVYLSMLPVVRTRGEQEVTGEGCYDGEAKTVLCSDPGGMQEASAKRQGTRRVEVWGRQSGVTAAMEIVRCEPALPGASLFISNAEEYNKLYFDFSGSCTARRGERWEIESFFYVGLTE